MMKINLISGRIKPGKNKKGEKEMKRIEIKEGKQLSAKEALEMVLSWEERECRIILMGILMGFSLPECIREMEEIRKIARKEKEKERTIII
jgi:hypothetical protein